MLIVDCCGLDTSDDLIKYEIIMSCRQVTYIHCIFLLKLSSSACAIVMFGFSRLSAIAQTALSHSCCSIAMDSSPWRISEAAKSQAQTSWMMVTFRILPRCAGVCKDESWHDSIEPMLCSRRCLVRGSSMTIRLHPSARLVPFLGLVVLPLYFLFSLSRQPGLSACMDPFAHIRCSWRKRGLPFAFPRGLQGNTRVVVVDTEVDCAATQTIF
jgi:hypothetical protein